MKQQSLFDEPLPPGFAYYPEFLSPAEERELLENIARLEWQEVRMHGVVARRRVAHFGMDYTYDSRTVTPTDPAPPFLHSLIKRGAACLAVPAADIAEVLVTHYPPGAGIGWHRDAPPFGDVFGISLAASCTLKLRVKRGERFEVYKKELEPRSAYVFSGPARWEWQHSIPEVKQARYSITLRPLRK